MFIDMPKNSNKLVFVTGGAGYVGSQLVPALLGENYKVRVLDLFIYGDDVFDTIQDKKNLECVKGDIRDKNLLKKCLKRVDTVIHLACISNDPSFELNPALGKSINLDAFRPLVELSIKAGVSRFIYASSASVYGVKQEENVIEELSLEPLTDYSKYKAICEEILSEYKLPDFTTCILRPSTACGYSSRQRFDLAMNILAMHAYYNKLITIFGGEQKRPNVHIKDMVRAYLHVLNQPREKINGKIFNVGFENYTIKELAGIVRDVIDPRIEMRVTSTVDNRSYHVSSEKIKKELGFIPRYTIRDAIRDLKDAFDKGLFVDPLNNKRYYNIKTMQALNLK